MTRLWVWLASGLVPLALTADQGAVIRRGIEVLGRAPVPDHAAPFGVAALNRRAAESKKLREHFVELIARRRSHAQPQVGRIRVGLADVEALDFEAAVVFNDRIEDLLHDMGVNQVALGLDDLLEGEFQGLL